MRKGTPLKAAEHPAKDPAKNIRLGFHISHMQHRRMKLLAAERHVKLQTVFTEALEHLLKLCDQKEPRYYAPPLRSMSTATTIWITRSLNDRLDELIERDRRPTSVIFETAAIAYLDVQSDL